VRRRRELKQEKWQSKNTEKRRERHQTVLKQKLTVQKEQKEQEKAAERCVAVA
jgi:hypothetical protein